MSRYIPRSIDPVLDELMADHPAVLLVGPRACGKTTTALQRAASRLRLDRAAEAVAARLDPDAVIGIGPFPLLIDEWQQAPEVLGAVKRAVDSGAPAGSYIITGSVQADLTADGWPATGRVIRLPMYGLTERELAGRTTSPGVLEVLAAGELDAIVDPPDPPDLRGYLERALRGTMPQAALTPSVRSRARWLDSYVQQALLRTPFDDERLRHRRARQYLRALAANTAGVPTHKTVFDSAELTRSTAQRLDEHFEQLMITERLPAWSGNRFRRLLSLPKRYLIDVGLIGPLLGVDLRAVIRDGDLIGRTIDTFVTSQLRAEAAAAFPTPHLLHLRDANGHREIDLLVEWPDGGIVAFEIKADAAPGPESARHLRWFADQLGDRFIAGIVLHTGPRILRWSERVIGVPIACLWS